MISEQECVYITQLLARGTPLRDVVGEALWLRLDGDDDHVARLHVDRLRLGSTVRLAPGTQLYFEPLRVDEANVAVAVEGAGEELDLVAHVLDYGGCVGVVYAGYGIVWVTAASVVAWHRLRDSDGDVIITGGDATTLDLSRMALDSLTLRCEGTFENLPPAMAPFALRVSGILPLLASDTLEAVAIERAVVARDDLAFLVNNFSRLASLSLDCTLFTWGQRLRQLLVERRSYGKLKSLKEDCDAPEWIPAFVGSLCSGIAQGVLQELYVDIQAMPSESDEGAVVK